jgi:hypothetical protein
MWAWSRGVSSTDLGALGPGFETVRAQKRE